MASIRDVAKQAGVGVGTVSRALNGTGYVSPDTKKKIEKAAEKLGYTPNELARNLYRNRTGIVGVMVPDLDHPFFSCLAKHIEMELYRQGYKTMICNTIGISDRTAFKERMQESAADIRCCPGRCRPGAPQCL